MWRAVEAKRSWRFATSTTKFSAPVFKLYPRARLYKDFRQMFDKEQKNFDALIVATPDHWQFSPGAGGPGHEQAHLLRQAHDAHDRRGEEGEGGGAGLQGHHQGEPQDSCTSPSRATTELLLSGAIGPVREVHFWTGTHCPSGLDDQRSPDAARGDELGTSGAARLRQRPYHKIYHYGNWRPWWDFARAT